MGLISQQVFRGINVRTIISGDELGPSVSDLKKNVLGPSVQLVTSDQSFIPIELQVYPCDLFGNLWVEN